MSETPPIKEISFHCDSDQSLSWFVVGRDGVTKIERIEKNGEFCMIPDVRVWRGEVAAADFCEHHLQGVFYQEPSP